MLEKRLLLETLPQPLARQLRSIADIGVLVDLVVAVVALGTTDARDGGTTLALEALRGSGKHGDDDQYLRGSASVPARVEVNDAVRARQAVDGRRRRAALMKAECRGDLVALRKMRGAPDQPRSLMQRTMTM